MAHDDDPPQVDLEATPPCEEVILLLEEQLEAARAGRIRAFGMVSVTTGYRTGTVYTLGDSPIGELGLLSALRFLERRIMDQT